MSIKRVSRIPKCLECGATTILRTSRYTGEKFWGCSKYPECRFTQVHVDRDRVQAMINNSKPERR